MNHHPIDLADPRQHAATVMAWHWLAKSGKLRDGTDPPEDGEWLKHGGKLNLCQSGLHASIKALDSLQYAPGPIVCRVECGGTMEHSTDKLVCMERRILWRANATATLRHFARLCALDVLHLWTAPPIVRQFLETGDESLRAAAWAAARAAAEAAARANQETRLVAMLEALKP